MKLPTKTTTKQNEGWGGGEWNWKEISTPIISPPPPSIIFLATPLSQLCPKLHFGSKQSLKIIDILQVFFEPKWSPTLSPPHQAYTPWRKFAAVRGRWSRGCCLFGNAGVGGNIGKLMKQNKPKSTLLADNTRGLITKQTKPRPVASAAPHPITPAVGGGGGNWKFSGGGRASLRFKKRLHFSKIPRKLSIICRRTEILGGRVLKEIVLGGGVVKQLNCYPSKIIKTVWSSRTQSLHPHTHQRNTKYHKKKGEGTLQVHK